MQVIKSPVPQRILTAFIILYLLSLTGPAISYSYNGTIHTLSAIEVFLVGGIAFIGGGMYESFIWLANPIGLLTVPWFIYNKRNAMVSSFTATIIALSYSLRGKVLAAENGSVGYITSLGWGYWLWALSFVVLAAGVTYYYRVTDK
ncbi:MAG: hypothetical protein RLZZ367_681 [Bacteroidota bacterium]